MDNLNEVAQMVAVKDLLPWVKNPRKNDPAVRKVADSIERFGFAAPIVARLENGEVIAGHTRLKAAKLLGLKEVPVRYVDLSEKEAHLLALADNKLGEIAEWDAEVVNILSEFSLDDAELAGFDAGELEKLGSALLGEDKEPPTDDVPEPPADPVTKPGDVWILGDHRLVCGDSTDAETVALLMNGEKADMWVTDPPYNIAYAGGSKERVAIENDSMSDENFRAFLSKSYAAADSSMRPGGAFYIWHADMESCNFRGAAIDIGWRVRQTLIWNKNNSVFGRSDFHWKHESCLYGWKGGSAHTWANDRKQATVLDFDRPSRSDEHPTMKPIALIGYCISNNSVAGDIILDSFGGSGTTLMACEQALRKCRILELSPAYCDVIVKRWEDYTGKKAVLESKKAA